MLFYYIDLGFVFSFFWKLFLALSGGWNEGNHNLIVNVDERRDLEGYNVILLQSIHVSI